MIQRFELEAAAAPGAPALVYDDEIVSYGELNRMANVIARELIAGGVEPESVVGLYLDRWPLRLAAILGVLKAGGAYLPLDPDHPVERLAATLVDSGARVLLVDASVLDHMPTLSAYASSVSVVDRLLESRQGEDPGNPEPRAQADNLAYVIYTSGTTGRPKGVMVTRHALATVATAWELLYDLRASTRRHLQAAPFAFDVFTGDWVRALTTGGVLVACPRHCPPGPGAAGRAHPSPSD